MTVEIIHDEDHVLDPAVLLPKTNEKGIRAVISVDPCVTRSSRKNADEKTNVRPGLPADQHTTSFHGNEAAAIKNNGRALIGDKDSTFDFPCDISPFALIPPLFSSVN